MSRLLLLLALLAFILQGCSGGTPSGTEEGRQPLRVWPDPPASPRLVLENTIHRAADLGIRPSLWQRLVKLVAGGAELSLEEPMMAVSDPAGRLYVADSGVGGVHLFDRGRGTHRVLRLAGGGMLPSPVGMALTGEGRLLVSDSSLGGVFVLPAGEEGFEPLPLEVAPEQPTGLAWDRGGKRLFVVDTARHTVWIYDRQGRVMGRIGKRGDAGGEFNYPTMAWWDERGGVLWVADSLNFRLQKFSGDGIFLAAVGAQGAASGYLSRPKGVAVDSEGHLYVVDALFNVMQLFDQQGNLLLYLGSPGPRPGQFLLPAGLFIDEGDRIYVADSRNRRVQVFRYLGSGS